MVLDWLAQEFEPGRRYSEAMVNLILGQRHPDTAALRRYLVDDEFLRARGGGVLADRRSHRHVTHYEVLGVDRDATPSSSATRSVALLAPHIPIATVTRRPTEWHG